jgi:glycerol-3-phosphate acyltransferase PlsX
MLIALDAMGGDYAPTETVKGALLAVGETDVEVALVGLPDVLKAELARHGHGDPPPSVRLVSASEVVDMHEPPAQAVRQKRHSSINEALRLLKQGEASAVVSAGNTGAVVASALLALGRLGGIKRPALGAYFPTGRYGVLALDVGANADCRPSYLVQFAHMGSIYMEHVYGAKRPRVGLLSIGEEEGKGNALTREVYDRLQHSALNFVGNVEGKEIMNGEVEVVVSDGFTGNVAVKMGEGMAEFMFRELQEAVSGRLRYRLGALLMLDALHEMRRRLDYAEYGGVPLLGVNGVVVICHGRSHAQAIKNAIRTAKEASTSGMLEAMQADLK